MNNDLISRDALKKRFEELHLHPDLIELIDNSPSVDIKDEIAGAYNEGYICGNKEAEKARPQSSLERPLYKGVLFVDDYGINKVIEVDENGLITAENIIPRDIFIN